MLAKAILLTLGFLHLIPNSTAQYIHDIHAQQYSSVILDCTIDMTGTPKWKHGEDILFLGKHALSTHSRDGMQLSENYSLIINPITLADEGVFECSGADSAKFEKYQLTVTVPALTFVTIDGFNAANLVYVEENKEVTAVCHAIGSKPVPTFEWCLNGDTLNDSNAKINISINHQNNQTFDTTSLVKYHFRKPAGNITCIAEGPGWTKQQSSVMFATFVNPKMFLSINDVRLEKNISVSEGQEINIVCSAMWARPAVKLALKINNILVEETEEHTLPSTDNYSKGTSDTTIETSFVPPGKNGTITCEIIGHVFQERIIQVVYFKKGEKDNGIHLMTLIVSGVSVGVFLVVGLICIYASYKRSKKTKSMSMLDSTRSALNCSIDDEYLVPALESCVMTDSFRSSTRRGLSSLENRLTLLNLDSADFKNMDVNPLDLALPDLPHGDDMDYGDYTTLPDNVYYSKSIVEGGCGKIYQRKDICFIVNMKKGNVYSRWMGTITIPNMNNKCVVITTLIDKLLRTKEIHWDVYVKGLLELPTNASNIARCEGICIDSGHLFLLQEHLTCENLDTHIKSNYRRENTSVNTLIDPIKRVQHCVDTLRGMEYLHSYGFLHPGLSTKKILLTSEGVCKLYDFCLNDDASAIVIIIKSKKSVSLNMLAPESILRNEYSRESDIWAIAVVIWNIINSGAHPFPENGSKASICNIDLKMPTNWPQRQFPFRNKSLIFNCWTENVTLRPTLKDLKHAFEEISESFSASDPVCTETNIYSSMEETKT